VRHSFCPSMAMVSSIGCWNIPHRVFRGKRRSNPLGERRFMSNRMPGLVKAPSATFAALKLALLY